jgi:hypothetical protein
MNHSIHILGGGTFAHVRPHFALSAPAFGSTANFIHEAIVGSRLTEDAQGWPEAFFKGQTSKLWLTRMARGGEPRIPPVGDLGITNEDVAAVVEELIADPTTKVIFFSVALCDYKGSILAHDPHESSMLHAGYSRTASGLNTPRLKTNEGQQLLELTPAEKVIGRIRKERKDIFLIGFKTTTGYTPQAQYEAGLQLLKKNSCNLVLANDLHTRLNMVVVPELGRYYETKNRRETLNGLVAMASKRHALTFNRTNVHQGILIPWDSDAVPVTLRRVVDHCVDRGAYKPFNNVTVGHFGFAKGGGIDDLFLSSRRKQNYNLPGSRDLVSVQQLGEGWLEAYGAKPSAGTTSQMTVLRAFYPKYDCIIHFHCPIKKGSQVTVRSQHDLECGSHECGDNTLAGMKDFGNVAAVMLDQHGPNIIFHHDADPSQVIAFIEENFDLIRRTGDDV